MQRVKEFDSIRGLASLAIVVYHLWLSNIGLLGEGAIPKWGHVALVLAC